MPCFAVGWQPTNQQRSSKALLSVLQISSQKQPKKIMIVKSTTTQIDQNTQSNRFLKNDVTITPQQHDRRAAFYHWSLQTVDVYGAADWADKMTSLLFQHLISAKLGQKVYLFWSYKINKNAAYTKTKIIYITSYLFPHNSSANFLLWPFSITAAIVCTQAILVTSPLF